MEISKIFDQCREHLQEIIKIRRDIHMHPETGFDTERTAGIVANELKKLGIQVKTGIGKTGVIGDINIPGARKCIALRADMDALSMEEQIDVPYKSKIKGKAHMCGHDAHTAILIGTARIISSLKSELKCNVRFIFQPSEEQNPGGALKMIEDGVLDKVDEIYGIHVWPLLEAGQFGISSGPFLAQADYFNIEIKGKGGHAALPHHAIDPILIGSQFVTLIQAIVARNIDPIESGVISVTRFQGGTESNVIPSSVQLEGTVRTFRKEVQQKVRQRFKNILSSLCSAHDADFNLQYREGSPPVTYNHSSCVEKALSTVKELVEESNIVYPSPPVMGSEDFGYYSEKIPACFIALGAGNKEKGVVKMCHDPHFDIDENCMLYGMVFNICVALKFE